jgi:MoaA/NifB/PqqE/SkfB family radical SAM enzyme
VISGGEPTMWRSQGKGILDLARAHQDNYFLMYTNGTLINETFARELAEVGNITPAISVEGFEKETDARRGEGTHRKIREAFGNLKKAGVPFGISVTATRFNAEQLMSDAFIDTYFEEQGALYGWIFQYMPIGRKFTLDLMVTPEQRAWMYEREQRLIRERKIFMADFWNSGALSDGCISAGRGGGYVPLLPGRPEVAVGVQLSETRGSGGQPDRALRHQGSSLRRARGREAFRRVPVG